MLNFHELRQQYRKTPVDPLNKALVTLLIASLLLGLSVALACAGEPVNKEKAILACVGESESEPFIGKVAIIATLFNRGHFKGVYGLTSQRVKQKKYDPQAYKDCVKAYNIVYANYTESTWEATGWGNAGDIEQFKRQGWFKNCVIVAHIGNHYFYKEVR